MTSVTALDCHAIRNTIAAYCLAIDRKDYAALGQVFTADAKAVYPFDRGTVQGVQAIGDMIHNRNQHCSTQHALTTQTIEIAADGATAMATTYFSGMHFGQGKWEGKVYTVWGQYVDSLVRINAEPTLVGASGQWRIAKREVNFTGTQGDYGVKQTQ